MGFAATALPRDNFKFKFYPARRQHKRSLLTRIELLLGLLSSSLGHGVCSYCLATSLGNLGSLSTDILSSGQLSILLLYSRVRVKLQHGADVLQRVGLHNGVLDFPVWCPQHLPDGFALKQGREISVGHLRLGQVPARLGRAGLAPCAVQTIELLEGSLGPDAESTDMATRGKLEQVKVVNLDSVHTRNVPECLSKSLVLIKDNQRSQLLDVSPVPQLSLASPHSPGGVHLGNIGPGLVAPQEHHGLLGLGERLDLVSNNKWHLRDALDLVALGHDQSWNTSSSNSRADGVSLLGGVNLPVPPSPGLGGGEHASTSAHVAESSLAGPVGTTTPDPGNPSNSSASSPGLSTGLVSSINIHTVWLPLVLSNLIVDLGHNVGPDGGPEHGWQANGGA